jgi:NAD+ kinase
MMAKSSTKNIVIFGDPKKGYVSGAINEFISFAGGKIKILANECIENCTKESLKKADYAIVFGGDGSIISAARQLSEMNVPVIGVNVGKLGFLAEFNVEELRQYFGRIIAGKANIQKRMMLSCDITCMDKGKFNSAAINDIFITAGPPYRMIELKITVDGQPLTSCVSDGLVIATPTGSTAYNLSAGGPILGGSMEAMVITPICPHSLSFRPIVINAKSKVEIKGLRVNAGTTVSIDGQIPCILESDDVVRIEKHPGVFLLVNNPMRTFWDTLSTKLKWAEKMGYNKI